MDDGAARLQEHDHVFLGEDHERNERRIWCVIGLTAAMMVVEIVAGTVYGSMALVADGWHMSTHAAALAISALAYRYARRHAHDPRFTFGTGKLGDLAGFASAIGLALIALLIAWESLQRLLTPSPIDFTQAIVVAVIGLAVNLLSAWMLMGDHAHHHHDHAHRHGHTHGECDHTHSHHEHDHAHGHDNNLRAAYLHVLADALTSVLAIAALSLGSLYGWMQLDPLMGLVGALVIARWSWGLVKDAGGILLDILPADEKLPRTIRRALMADGERIIDLHVWQIGPGHYSAIVSLISEMPKAPSYYKAKLSHIRSLSHITIEVEGRDASLPDKEFTHYRKAYTEN